MSGGYAGAGPAAPPTVRAAALILAAHAVWLTWIEVQALRSPAWTWLHVLMRAAVIVVLCVLARGLWRRSARARVWAIGVLATLVVCYLLMAAIVRHFLAERWDPSTFFGAGAILRNAWSLVPIGLLLLPSSRMEARAP